jgi:hypothetical protein
MSDPITLALSPSASLVCRPTPWDERIFGYPCMEILGVEAPDDVQLAGLLGKFDDEARARGVRFAYTRIDGGSAPLKRVLHEAGFYYAESSYRILHRKVQGSSHFDKLIRRGPELVLAEPSHFDAIRQILADDFNHGRIHEDPWVERELAASRYRYWLSDLATQGHEIYVYLLRGEVIGTHIQRRDGAIADLVLTGVKRSHALLGVSLWAEVMHLARQQGVAEAHTLISAANLPIVNLYRNFEFHFDEFLCGFHKRYPA